MVKAKVSTKVIGKENLDRLRVLFKDLSKYYVTVGVHEDAGKYTEGKNPPSVVEVALWNEFGTEHTPERSFFRSTLAEKSGLINQWRQEVIGNMITKGWTPAKALETLGFRLQILIQNKIKSNVPPKNAPSVIAHKQAEGLPTTTLMETQLLLRSVTFKVYV